MTKVAIVILNYNGKDYLEQFLPALLEHSEQQEVVVADNKSSDDSMDFLAEKFPNVRTIHLNKNYGFAGGYNKALLQIESPYYVLINSDIEVTPGWLAPLITFLDDNPEYAGCQPKIRDQKKRDFFEYAGAAGGFVDMMGYPYCRGRIFDDIEKDTGQYDQDQQVFWSTGACMIIRSEDFHRIGGFDEDFFAHMEEIDLCWRLQNYGRKFACIAASKVFHVGGGTLSKSNPRKTYLNFRNGLTLLLKNLVWYELWKIPIRMFLDLIAGLKFWRENDLRHFTAILKAQWSFLSSIRKTTSKRDIIQHKSIDRAIIYSKILIWDRFAKGKKKFSELTQ